ncbi:hypothetical protein Hanom_Chr13g01234401 [Helianthus anomalus]
MTPISKANRPESRNNDEDTSQLKFIFKLQLLRRSFFFIIINRKIRIMRLRFKIIPSKHIKRKRRQLSSHHTSPKILIRRNRLQRVNHNPSKINITYHHNIILPKQRQLHQINRSLPIRPRSLSQILNRPHDRKQNRATTNHIHQQKHLLPRHPILRVRPRLVYNNLRDIRHHLQRDHNHQNLLFLILQIRFQKRPTRPNQHD